jgi:hypothetical protein
LEGIRSVTARKSADAGITFGLVFIVTRQNIGEIPAFIALARELNVDSIFIRTLKSRTLQEQRLDGLDYHRLPPYLDPDFEALRRRAVDAITRSSIPVQAAPETWSTKIFPARCRSRYSGRASHPARRQARVERNTPRACSRQ